MPAGVVAEFDTERGLGVIAGEHGSPVDFHCTAVGDGTRVIAVGASVRFEFVPGRHGRWEAAAVHAVAG